MIINIKKKVLNEIKPTDQDKENLKFVKKKILNILNNIIYKLNFEEKIVPIFVGSSERGTWIKNCHDVDLFISFPNNISINEMIHKSIMIFKELIKYSSNWEDKHSEHPYIHITFEKYEIDVVPCFRIENFKQIKSSVDRTPLHCNYLKNKIYGLEDEVILLKQFMKNINVYGSEVKNKGFSGYLSELLIVKYKTFENTLKNASIWNFNYEIDIESHKSKKHKDPLIVIDPTDPKRNVAAALSINKLSIFIDNSRSFIISPNISYFFSQKKSLEKNIKNKVINLICKRNTNIFMLYFTLQKKIPEDTIYPQVEKMMKAIIQLLRKYEFNMFGSKIIIEKNNYYILFELSSIELPNLMIINGPPIWDIINSYNFKKIYEPNNSFENITYSIYIDNGFYKAKIQRKYKNAIFLLRDKINNDIPIGKSIKNNLLKQFEFIQKENIYSIKSDYIFCELFNYLTNY